MKEIEKKVLKRVCLIALTILVLVGGWAAACFVIDPLSLFHASLPEPYLPAVGQSRFRNPGQIINYGHRFEGALIGNSVAANFSPELIKEKLGFYPMRLTMDGSTLSLQAKEVGLFLRNNSDSTNVFWVLYGFFKPSNFDGDSGGVVDLTLYDDIRVNDIEVYMSYYILSYIKIKLLKNPKTINNEDYYWMDKFADNYSLSATEKGFVAKKFEISEKSQEINNRVTENIRNNIEPWVRKYPKSRFRFVLPPISVIMFKHHISGYKRIMREMLALSEKYKNIEIYNFYMLEDIITDISNYRDQVHYSAKVNDLMVELMGRKQYLLDAANIEKAEKIMDYYATIKPEDIGIVYDEK